VYGRKALAEKRHLTPRAHPSTVTPPPTRFEASSRTFEGYEGMSMGCPLVGECKYSVAARWPSVMSQTLVEGLMPGGLACWYSAF
jgi:hypothetical protein